MIINTVKFIEDNNYLVNGVTAVMNVIGATGYDDIQLWIAEGNKVELAKIKPPKTKTDKRQREANRRADEILDLVLQDDRVALDALNAEVEDVSKD